MAIQSSQTAARGHWLRRHAVWGALVAYLLLSLLLLSRVLPAFGQAIMGGPIAEVDGWQNVWNLWWTAQSLATGSNPFETTMLYYPMGVSLYLQPLNVTNGIMGAWLTWLAGPIAAYNFCVLVAFTLSGWGTYLLARRLALGEPAAFFAGLVMAFSPFHLTKLTDGQLEHIALQWVPLWALFLVRTMEDRRRADIALTAVFFALVALTSWYHALFCAVLGGLLVVLWAAARPRQWRPVLGRAAMALGGGLLLLTPVLVLGMRDLTWPQETGEVVEGAFRLQVHSADLVDFFLPSTLHPLWGHVAHEAGLRLHPVITSAENPLLTGWNVALGYLALLLALYGLATAWREGWRWGTLLLGALLLALGPTLRVGGHDTGLPMPYALLLRLPFMHVAQRPNQFTLLAVLALALLAGLGLREALRRLRPRWQPLLFALCLVLLAGEYLPRPLPLLKPHVHPYYAQLAGGAGAVLDLPERRKTSETLLAQIVHGRPIAGGFLARRPVFLLYRRLPGMKNLWVNRPLNQGILQYEPEVALLALRTYGFHDLVIHWDEMEPAEQVATSAMLQEILGAEPPLFQDETTSFYRLPTVPWQPFAWLGQGWHDLERNEQYRWRWSGSTAEIYLVNPRPEKASALVQLQWLSYLEPSLVDLYLDGRWLTQVEVPAGPEWILLWLALPPGEHLLELHAETHTEQAPPHRTLGIACLAIIVQ